MRKLFEAEPLVLFRESALHKLLEHEVIWLIKDSINDRFDRFSPAALSEFVFTSCVDPKSEVLRNILADLGRTLVAKGHEEGLDSAAAREHLLEIASRDSNKRNR